MVHMLENSKWSQGSPLSVQKPSTPKLEGGSSTTGREDEANRREDVFRNGREGISTTERKDRDSSGREDDNKVPRLEGEAGGSREEGAWPAEKRRIGRKLERKLSTRWSQPIEFPNVVLTFLLARPPVEELQARGVLPSTSCQEREEFKRRISARLERRISVRPSQAELQDRNILKDEAEARRLKEETRQLLQRRLSFRPTVVELKRRRILQFAEYIEVGDSFSSCICSRVAR